MNHRRITSTFRLSALLLSIVGASEIQHVGPPAPAEEDRRSDLAGLRTLLALGSGSGLITSERAEVQAQLARLEGDGGAELDARRRARLRVWLQNLGLAV